MSYTRVISDIEQLPHFREVECKQCGSSLVVHALQINAVCDGCGVKMKLRGYAAIGSEVQDVIDAVLKWMGTGSAYEATMKRHKAIHDEIS